ncbi:hypothetical protein [Coleofasciculus sp. F4-SAH-05]|uniref:hypothetical protein n=1 Tax=Coleofasciculus sp. F4-SAH-05 TaxID=3069525 RepID=UPI0040649A52
MLIPIVGIGLYPKVATQTYDVKTVAVTAQVRQVLPVVAQERTNLYSGKFNPPSLPQAKAQPLLAIVE